MHAIVDEAVGDVLSCAIVPDVLVALVEWNDQALDECFGQRGGGRGGRAAPDGGEQREVDPDPDAGADLQELDRVARHRANFASDHLGDVLRDLEACDLRLGPRPGVSIGIEVDDFFALEQGEELFDEKWIARRLLEHMGGEQLHPLP